MTNTGKMKITTTTGREIVMTREPELVRQWLVGPPGWTLPVCEINLRVVGTCRYLWRNAGGTEMGMRGVLREILPPFRYESRETRDAVLKTPIAQGVAAGYDRLAVWLAAGWTKKGAAES